MVCEHESIRYYTESKTIKLFDFTVNEDGNVEVSEEREEELDRLDQGFVCTACGAEIPEAKIPGLAEHWDEI